MSIDIDRGNNNDDDDDDGDNKQAVAFARWIFIDVSRGPANLPLI